MSRSHFERGTAVFNCRCCGRRTRNTTDVCGNTLCAQCDEASMIENGISDYGDPTGSEQKRVDQLYNEAVAKGGTLSGYPKALAS